MVEPINFTAALRRSWRLLVVLAALFAVIAVLLPVSHPKVDKNDPTRWQTTSIVGAPPGNGIVGSGTVSIGQILFFGSSFEVKAAALSDAKTPGPFLTMVGAMSASPQTTKSGSGSSTAATAPVVKATKNGTGLVQLTTSAATREESAALTNAYAKVLGTTLTGIAASASGDTTRTTTPAKGQSATASTPQAPSTGYEILVPAEATAAKRTTKASSNLSSSHKVRLLAGLVLGLIVGVLIVLVVELLNKKLRTGPRAEAHFKFPVIAEVPETWPPPGDEGSPRIVVVAEPTSRSAEAYRKLRMSVMFEAMAPAGVVTGSALDPYADSLLAAPVEPYSPPEPGTRAVILVVSPGTEASRPRVVANLGATYAESGQRVVIVSTGDLDSGVPAGSDATYTGPVGPDDVQSHLQPSSIANLSMLSLRPFVRNSAQLVNRAAPIFDAARQVADVVLVEAPPFLEFHHGEALAHAVDVVLVVGECGATTFDHADETGVQLRRIGAPVLGVVFTEVPIDKADKRPPKEPATSSDAPAPAAPIEPPAATDQFPTESQE
jgi:Mrp family chromosome partitioning ATPase